jgi:hypothetical protein
LGSKSVKAMSFWPQSVKNIDASMNLSNPDRDSEDLYTNESADGNKWIVVGG